MNTHAEIKTQKRNSYGDSIKPTIIAKSALSPSKRKAGDSNSLTPPHIPIGYIVGIWGDVKNKGSRLKSEGRKVSQIIGSKRQDSKVNLLPHEQENDRKKVMFVSFPSELLRLPVWGVHSFYAY